MCELFYAAVMITSKMSIGFFLLRVTVKRSHAWIIYGAVLTSILAGIAFFFVVLLQCNPVSDYWMKFVGQNVGTCLNVEVVIALAYLYSACSIVADFTLALLPVFLIASLKMDMRTKILLVPLLGMGTMYGACHPRPRDFADHDSYSASAGLAVRCPYLLTFRDPDFLCECLLLLQHFARRGGVRAGDRSNVFLGATIDIAIWSTVEQGLAITAGSLATTRPLLRRVFEKIGASRPSEGGTSGMGQKSGPSDNHHGGAARPPNDSYKLSHIVKGSKNDWSRRDSDEDAVIDVEYGVQTNISVGQGRSAPRHRQFSESQDELGTEHSNGESSGDGAVVARSFLVTSEKR